MQIPSKLTGLGSDIITSIGNGVKSIGNNIKDVFNSIGELPDKIKEGIKDIFVPDSEYINESYASFVEELKMKFNLDSTAFESLFSHESVVTDKYMDYTLSGVGTFHVKALDTSFLKKGVEEFRPIIRGFVMLLLFIYNMRQLIGFFGGNAGAISGKVVQDKE